MHRRQAGKDRLPSLGVIATGRFAHTAVFKRPSWPDYAFNAVGIIDCVGGRRALSE